MFEKTGQQTTIIGEGVIIEGDFTGQGDLELYGEIKGNINIGGHIKVGPKAKVNANIVCNKAEIAGRVRGRVTAKQDIDLNSTASITGDIKSQQITISKGALVNGKMHIDSKNQIITPLDKSTENKKGKTA